MKQILMVLALLMFCAFAKAVESTDAQAGLVENDDASLSAVSNLSGDCQVTETQLEHQKEDPTFCALCECRKATAGSFAAAPLMHPEGPAVPAKDKAASGKTSH